MLQFLPSVASMNYNWLAVLRRLLKKPQKIKRLEIYSGIQPLGTVEFTKEGFEYESNFKLLKDFLKEYSGEVNIGYVEDVKLGRITQENYYLLANALIKEGYSTKEIMQ